jgi:hypothetical protein
MELDIFVPSLAIAVEYQGQQHYHNHEVIGSAENYTKRDEEKKIRCEEMGITLIQVPYWWKRDTETIVKMICDRRPDVALPEINTVKKRKHSIQSKT